MSQSPSQTDLSLGRRGFVGAAGVATVALGVPVLAALPADAARPLRVGVLVPERLSYARAGESLLAGLACGFATARHPVAASFHSRGVAQGHAGAAAATSALLAKKVDVIVAGVSALTAESIAPLCHAKGVSLVVAGVGAHVVPTGAAGVLHVGLQQWQAAHAMGAWARTSLGGSLFEIVAAPDAGYDAVYATARSFQSAGGALLGRALTHDRPVGSGVDDAVAAARASGAAVVVVHASGRRAAEILGAIRRAGLSAKIVADALAVDDAVLPTVGAAASGVHSASTWVGRSTAGSVRDFVHAFRAANRDRRPDAFAVIGHDAARAIAVASRRTTTRSAWASTLVGHRIDGARGTLVVGADGVATTRISIRRVAKGRNVELARTPRIVGVPPTLASLRTTEVAGYVNEYLGT
jgi:branched-chain amino acid transport system substrate-binding protein